MSSLLLHGVLPHGMSCGGGLAPRLRGCVRVLSLPAAAAVSSAAAAALAVAALAVAAAAASRALLGQRGHRGGGASPLRPHHHHANACNKAKMVGNSWLPKLRLVPYRDMIS